MKENRISIIINRPVQEVFAFTIDPNNISKWIDGIKEEQTSECPIKIGTIYKNTGDGRNWQTYQVIELKKDKLFTLKQQNSSYCVRYTYKSLGKKATELTYFEWDEDGLADPFFIEVLEKLKLIFDSSKPQNSSFLP